jgi:hypothetical protein
MERRGVRMLEVASRRCEHSGKAVGSPASSPSTGASKPRPQRQQGIRVPRLPP